ncbi:MAG: PD-(D/E)XK motif protein [Sporichthyaceae bacterium]
MGIATAQGAGAINGVRVDPANPFDCFWTRDSRGRKSWALFAGEAPPSAGPLPKLKGLELALSSPAGGKAVLLLTLKDADSADLFRQLCVDLTAAANGATRETEAVARVLARTWRWHHLMRGGPNRVLSKHEQMGLIAELEVLERSLAPQVGLAAGLLHWFGPLDGPKDFELGTVAVEVKARRGGAAAAVKISSEDQLDASGFARMYLAVVQVDEAMGSETAAVTLAGRIAALREGVASTAPEAVELLESRLAGAGYRDEDEYATAWLVAETVLYEVRDGFPALTPGGLPVGVDRVSYSLSLASLAPYRAEPSDLSTWLESGDV